MDILKIVLDKSFYLTIKNIPFKVIQTNYADIVNIIQGIDYRNKYGVYIIYDSVINQIWYVGIAADSDIRDRNIRHRRQAYGKASNPVEAWFFAHKWMSQKGYDYISNVSIMVIDTIADKKDLKCAEEQLISLLNPMINRETFNPARFEELI